MPGQRRKDAETHEPETYCRQKPKWCIRRTHSFFSHVNGLCRLWCEGVMFLDWLIVLLRSVEGAQVGTGSPPWYLLSDRWSVRSKGV
jgi:hypothetical protein